jgi:hypothetical protein
MAMATLAMPAHATKPCTQQSEEAFRADLTKSSSIIKGMIVTAGLLKVGARVQIKEQYKGNIATNTTFVTDWKFYDPPLFEYKPGDILIFVLTRKNGANYLTNSSWAECVPSLIHFNDDTNNLIYDRFREQTLSVADFFAHYLKEPEDNK